MRKLISKPSLGLGFARGGAAAQVVQPLVNLTDISPQSYVPTWDSLEEFTVSMRFEDLGAPASNQYIFSIRTGTNLDNYVQAEYRTDGTIRTTIRSAGTSVVKDVPAVNTNYALGQGDISVTIAFKANDYVLAINGIIIFQSTGTIPASTGTVNDMGIGQNIYGSGAMIPAIRAFQYYNKRLDNAQIRALGSHTSYGLTAASYDSARRIVYALGQSNAVGETGSTPPITYTNAANMGLITKDGVFDSTYQDPSADNGTGALFANFADEGTFSGIGTFMDSMLSAAGGKAAAMHVDRGSTGLVNTNGNFAWTPYSTSGSDKTLQPPAYQALLMQKIGALHGTPYMRVWYQGEQDAKNLTSQQDYEDQLHALLNLFEAALPVAQTIIVGLAELPEGTYPDRADVRAAQQAVATARSKTIFIDAAGLERLEDNTHLSNTGQQDLWALISTAMGY